MASSDQFQRKYIDPKRAARTWRPSAGVMSPGMRRARAPFLLRNTITGILLGTFVVSVYTYSIRAVKQDDFGDIDAEAKAQREAERTQRIEKMRKDTASATVLTVGEEKNVMERAAQAVAKDINIATMGVGGLVSDETSGLRASQGLVPAESEVRESNGRRGVLVGILEKTFPSALDPTRKTLVWGAPDVDNIGTVSSKK
ncbi:hypothetical protein GYMLUDRAFT_49473 [Collybiopsis luxurians FD-317 M1]|uniref:Cytochrome c oxidase assembly factor 3 n=1 Tax=Collybiopsis luxurians FD-317 M1 TaxID=944289 RepID=A0A0D0CE76_9AGAR|nr:hypothetical protein GYMLUDRAFT_49473 [Collybiopsis luxurians FD-317 M1]